MRAITRLRVSAPTSAHPRTTLETVITDTLRSFAMSFRRTGELGTFDIEPGARRQSIAIVARASVVYTVADGVGKGVSPPRVRLTGPSDRQLGFHRNHVGYDFQPQ